MRGVPSDPVKYAAMIAKRKAVSRVQTIETKAKISAAMKGRNPTGGSFKRGDDPRRMQRRGEKNPKWKGIAVGYRAAHQRLGPVSGSCSDGCGESAQDWALKPDVPIDRLQKDLSGQFAGLLYSVERNDYVAMAHKCHMKQDLPGPPKLVADRGRANRWAKRRVIEPKP
jgi:hypothetical protein